MTELENRLRRELRDVADGVTSGDLPPLREPVPRSLSLRWRWLAPVAAAAAVAAVAGGLWLAREGPPSDVTPNANAMTCASVPAAGRLCDRLVLGSTRALAGTVITGVLLVDNRSGRRITYRHPSCGDPIGGVVLTNRHFPPQFPQLTCLEVKPVVLPPGISRMPISILTRYLSCAETGSRASAHNPKCAASGEPPPLPAGRYTAVLVGSPLPTPRAVPVILRSPDIQASAEHMLTCQLGNLQVVGQAPGGHLLALVRLDAPPRQCSRQQRKLAASRLGGKTGRVVMLGG